MTEPTKQITITPESPKQRGNRGQFKKGIRAINHWKGTNKEEETKRKIGLANSLALKGRHLSEETKIRMGEARRGRKLSEEHIRKLREKPPVSIETRRKIGDAHRGERCYWWRGGISSESERKRKSVQFRLWRESVFARDNWTCQGCGQRGNGNLHPHHIQNFAQYPELRFAIDNGITFCEKCHRLFHRRYGSRDNNKEQLMEFLHD